jgi:Sec-independent protein translocase protein TatA
MPHLPEALIIVAVIILVLGAHNLRRLGDSVGRFLEKISGKT